MVLDLNPATWYNLKVTAHNSAGFAIAENDALGVAARLTTRSADP